MVTTLPTVAVHPAQPGSVADVLDNVVVLSGLLVAIADTACPPDSGARSAVVEFARRVLQAQHEMPDIWGAVRAAQDGDAAGVRRELGRVCSTVVRDPTCGWRCAKLARACADLSAVARAALVLPI